jgi:hypothetical protein
MRYAVLVVLFVACAFVPGSQAQAYAPYGCPAELASLTFPEPRVCQETQGWWIQGQTSLSAPASTFPFTSTHVHLMIPFPTGERLVIPANGGYSWPYLAQFHNGQGGKVRQVRSGFVGPTSSLGCCPKDPNYLGVPIATQDQRHAGSIPIEAVRVDGWRAYVGKAEGRFTADTTSPFGQRQYQSGAWNVWMNTAPSPVSVTARGWYEGPGYTNVNLTTKVTAHGLATSGLPSTVSYSLAQGATWAFAYIDPNIHAGSKGIVLFENRTGSSGSFSLPSLPSGDHVLLLGGWEKSSAGWNAGVLRLPFYVS